MPREIAPGVFWIGDCLAQRHKGRIYHGYNAAFLIAGNGLVPGRDRPSKGFPGHRAPHEWLFARASRRSSICSSPTRRRRTVEVLDASSRRFPTRFYAAM
jgi:hypothetical protein